MTVTLDDIETLKEKRLREKARHYIENVCDGMDLHRFDDYREAREFGLTVRENNPEFAVEISVVTVRIRMKE